MTKRLQVLFEDDEGGEDKVEITDLVKRLRDRLPGRLPPFFYLAACHGNEPGAATEVRPGVVPTEQHVRRLPCH